MSKAERKSKIQADKKKDRDQLEKKGQLMEKIVTEKKETAKASREVLRSTTVEGAKQLEAALKKAAKASEVNFEKQDHALKNKFAECKKAEKNLKEKTENARRDAQSSERLAGQIKETQQARRQALEGKKISIKDGNWTDGQRRERQSNRKKSETRRNRQQNAIRSTRLAF